MSVKIMVGEGEEIARALQRFRRLVQQVYGRSWTKHRLGYFEKPSALRRKRKRMNWRQKQVSGNLKLHVGLEAQCHRTGPSNALGR